MHNHIREFQECCITHVDILIHVYYPDVHLQRGYNCINFGSVQIYFYNTFNNRHCQIKQFCRNPDVDSDP